MHLFTQSVVVGVTLSALILSLPSVTAAAPQRTISDIDRIVVIVNDDVITDSELNQRLRETKKQLVLEKISAPPDAARWSRARSSRVWAGSTTLSRWATPSRTPGRS